MVDPSWQDKEVIFLHLDSDPAILFAANIKVATPLQDEADLFVLMEMFLKEIFDLHWGRTIDISNQA